MNRTILREVKTFYKTFHSSKDAELIDVDLKHVLYNADIKKIRQNESSLLEGFLPTKKSQKLKKKWQIIAVQVQMVL